MDLAEVFDQRIVQRHYEIVGARRTVVLLGVEPARCDVGVPGQHQFAARNGVSGRAGRAHKRHGERCRR
jgi:hypothetical protein